MPNVVEVPNHLKTAFILSATTEKEYVQKKKKMASSNAGITGRSKALA